MTDEIAITHAKAVQRWKSVIMNATEKREHARFLLAQLPFLLNFVDVSFSSGWVKICVRSTVESFGDFTSLLIIRNSDALQKKKKKADQEQAEQTPGTPWPELSTLSLSSHPSVDFIALSAARSECSPPNHNLRFLAHN